MHSRLVPGQSGNKLRKTSESERKQNGDVELNALQCLQDAVPFEMSAEDIADGEIIQKMYGPTAPACCDRNCNKHIPKSTAVEHRYVASNLPKRTSRISPTCIA